MRFLQSLIFAFIIASFFSLSEGKQFSSHYGRHHPLFSHTPLSETQMNDMFHSFMKQYSKKYSHEELRHRYTIFKSNIEKIRIHNSDGKKKSYTMDINQYADLTAKEFKEKYYGFKSINDEYYRSKNSHEIIKDAPESIDWRNYGAVTPVKNQGICGACWAFSTTGSIEGAYVLQGKNELISFSEQQLLDCSQSYGTAGCNGGYMDQAFQYIIATGGLCSEASYPYINTTHLSCLASSCTRIAKLKGFIDVPINETALLNAVGTVGPVSVGIEADSTVFQFYKSGIINDASCGTELDHGVLTVGYGTENGQDYWIVKNSWGSSWGESGYVRLARNVNQCGISQKASYPTM